MIAEIVTLLAWLLGLAAALALFGLVWWGLFGDRESHRRRCPVCWHDLSETPGFTCGECGFEAGDESQFHRRRRRLGVAAVACLALVAGIAAAHWHFGGSGWARPLPSRALVALLPFSSGSTGDLHAEIVRRVRSGEFEEHHFEALFARLERGDRGAAPASPAWIERYGPLAEWWRRPGFGTADQRRRLSAFPAALTLTPPSFVREAEPSVVHLRLTHWWPADIECRVRVTSTFEEFVPLVASRSANDARAPVLPIVLPPLPRDRASIELVIDVERRIAPESTAQDAVDDEPWSAVERRVVTVPLPPRAGDAALRPVDSPTMSAALGQTFGHGIRRWRTGVRRFGVQFAPQVLDPMEFEDVAVGVRVEVLEAGVPRRETLVWWMNRGFEPTEAAWEIVHEDGDALDRATDGDPAWTLRITGDPTVAARAAIFRAGRSERSGSSASTDADGAGDSSIRYWAGSIEMPLIVRDHSGTAPRRRWQIDVDPLR